MVNTSLPKIKRGVPRSARTRHVHGIHKKKVSDGRTGGTTHRENSTVSAICALIHVPADLALHVLIDSGSEWPQLLLHKGKAVRGKPVHLLAATG